MNITLSPSSLHGEITMPSSKSFAHRQLIAASLADRPTRLHINTLSEDVKATIRCLQALGANIILSDHDTVIFVEPITARPETACLFCGESGSTLRFLLPIAAVLGISCTFDGTGRLPGRPNKPLLDAMRNQGIQASSDFLPLHLHGKLKGGTFSIAGNVSSQYITGLLMALPLCEENSEIHFTTPLESAPYLDITLDVLKQFGINISKTENGFCIPSRQTYHSPSELHVEGDWSAGVFWHCANAMGHNVSVNGLNPSSSQGDAVIEKQLSSLGDTIDVSQTPDSLPALAVAACFHPGITHFIGAARLRLKESDRLSAITDMLCALGQNVTKEDDGLIIQGSRFFRGCTVNGYNDHRIVMAAAIAASCASAPVTITDAEAVRKSYPQFFSHFEMLGGIVHG